MRNPTREPNTISLIEQALDLHAPSSSFGSTIPVSLSSFRVNQEKKPSNPSKVRENDDLEIVSQETILAQLQDDVKKLEELLIQVKERQNEQKITFLKLQVKRGIKQLETEAKHINILATQLEAEILKFQETAIAVNGAYQVLQEQLFTSQQNPKIGLNLCEMKDSVVPIVIKQGFQFILTFKTVKNKREWRKKVK